MATLPWGPQYLIKLALNKSMAGTLYYPPSDSVRALIVASDEYIDSHWMTAFRGDRLFSEHWDSVDFDRLQSQEHPHLGTIVEYQDGWIFSKRFGYLNIWYYPWIEHAQIGWILFDEKTGQFTFNHREYGSIMTDLNDYHQWTDAEGNTYTLFVDGGVVEWR